MRVRRALLLISGTLGIFLSSAPLFAHKDDYIGDTFVFVTLGRRELEFEYWLDGRFGPRGALHTLGAEYGLTDHLMADVSGRWFQKSGGPFSFEEGFIEMRYRFGEEGERPVDFAASVEYRVKRLVEERETHEVIEPRIVLSKDLGGWNFTANLFYSFVLDEKKRSAFEASLGARTPDFGRWNAGVELRRELALENESTVIPQVWYRIGPEAHVKLGAGKNFAGQKDSFARVAIELEF